MKTKLYILPTATIALLFGAAFISCSSGEKRKTRENLPEDVRPVAEAIINDSPEEFASIVNYPIERPYPLKSVEDSAEMVRYYSTLMDNKIKKIVETAPDSTWFNAGWRGWTLGDGSYFWVDSGKIYDVSYVSDREHHMLDSLQKVEIASLEPSLQAGWTPVMCVMDTSTGVIFRIDAQDSANPPIYRLAGYANDNDLSGSPEIMLYGSLDLEGSMGNRFYTFSDENGTTAIYAPDISSDEDEPEIEIDRNGKAKKYKAKPDYWLDHIKKKKVIPKGKPGHDKIIGDSLRLKNMDNDSVQSENPVQNPSVVEITDTAKKDTVD